eukprot:m.146277 g.146277  ORF g.146277 m.146277 type:complete len:296 (-) comp16082_c0_seq1:73-960(-)
MHYFRLTDVHCTEEQGKARRHQGMVKKKCVIDAYGVPRIVICNSNQKQRWRPWLWTSSVVLLSLVASPFMAPSDLVKIQEQSDSLVQLPETELHQFRVVEERHSTNNCSGYGLNSDPYFLRFGGKACQYIRYASKQPTDVLAAKMELFVKKFTTQQACIKYFKYFWGSHLREPIHFSQYTDVSSSIPSTGDESKAFLWDPFQTAARMTKSQPQTPSHEAKHIALLFRQGRFFVVILAASKPRENNPIFSPAELQRFGSHLTRQRNVRAQPLQRVRLILIYLVSINSATLGFLYLV